MTLLSFTEDLYPLTGSDEGQIGPDASTQKTADFFSALVYVHSTLTADPQKPTLQCSQSLGPSNTVIGPIYIISL